MNEWKESQVDPQQDLPEEEKKEVYTPRPVWQRVLAGVLAALMILGVIGYYYWIMYRY